MGPIPLNPQDNITVLPKKNKVLHDGASISVQRWQPITFHSIAIIALFSYLWVCAYF